jgi:hypothetical protein
MKKSIRKLILRSETVRKLRPLELNAVTEVRGGDGAERRRFESTIPCGDGALPLSRACG